MDPFAMTPLDPGLVGDNPPLTVGADTRIPRSDDGPSVASRVFVLPLHRPNSNVGYLLFLSTVVFFPYSSGDIENGCRFVRVAARTSLPSPTG